VGSEPFSYRFGGHYRGWPSEQRSVHIRGSANPTSDP
jgi:hypothetical protein